MEQRNKVRGLAHDRNVAKITLVAVPDRPGVAHAIFAPLADAGINVDMIVQNVGHGGTTDMSFTVARSELARAKRILEPIVRDLGFREMTTDSAVAKVSIVGAGIHNAPGYAARMFGTLADAGVNIEMISTSEVRITCIIAEDDVETAVRALHAAFELERPDAIDGAGSRAGPRREGGLTGAVAASSFLARRERFASVGSTNDVVRAWLAEGVPEVCLAVADEQTAGRGRDGRTWTAPPGAGLLLSVGFRPTWLDPERTWRLAAIVALAMADAAEACRRPAAPDDPPEVAERPRPRGPGPGPSASSPGCSARRPGSGGDDPRAIVGHRDQRRLGHGPTSRRRSRRG